MKNESFISCGNKYIRRSKTNKIQILYEGRKAEVNIMATEQIISEGF